MGANLQGKDIKNIITEINPAMKKKPQISVEEVNSEWRRLVSTMRGLK